MKLVSSDDPVLKQKCWEVPEYDLQMINDIKVEMISLMRFKKGLGLAAPQVGMQRAFFVWNAGVVINPVILEKNDPFIFKDEGCLSYPGVRKDVTRYANIKVTYRDYKWNEITETLTGIKAVIFQHECDHLDGCCAVAKEG